MTVVAVIQARLGSTRLPGKVLYELAGRPMIGLIADRVRRAARIDDIVLATGEGTENDALADVAAAMGIKVFRGSEDDVLERFRAAAASASADVVVRVTGDCPLIDPGILDELVELRQRGGLDYATNVLPPTWPDGLDCSVFTMDTLNAAHAEARLGSEREHVVPWMWKHATIKGGTRLASANLAAPRDLSAHRWTVDEPRDLRFLRVLAGHFGNDGLVKAGWHDIVAAIEANPAWAAINGDITRDAGYAKSLEKDRECGK